MGAIKHHQVCLFFYMVILFLIFFIQFAIACACLALSDEQKQKIIKTGRLSTFIIDCFGYKDRKNEKKTLRLSGLN